MYAKGDFYNNLYLVIFYSLNVPPFSLSLSLPNGCLTVSQPLAVELVYEADVTECFVYPLRVISHQFIMNRSKGKTRSTKSCPLIGDPCELSKRCLPTYGDILRACSWERFHLKTTGQEPRWKVICKNVSEEIENIWSASSVPTVTSKRIIAMLTTYHSKYNDLLKNVKGKPSKNLLKKQNEFKEMNAKLFDIAACKCLVDCACPKNRKVPQLEKEFLADQRGERKMAIAGIDLTVTKSNAQRIRRKQRSQARNEAGRSESPTMAVLSSSETSSTEAESSDSDYEEQLPMCKKMKEVSQMTLNLSSLAKICDRTGTSDRAAAAIASSTLQDFGIVTEDDSTKVIDRSKVRRARSRVRKETSCKVGYNKASSETGVTSIFFDGRRDKTLTVVRKGVKRHISTATEEHITILEEPGSKYICHVTPTGSTADHISEAIIKSLQEKNLDLEQLCAVGCDGTAVNTGRNKGIISRLEHFLQRPLQWVICLLHANELPLRHLVIKLDGATKSPTGFTGVIGKQLDKCEKLPIVKYVPIAADKINADVQDLSTDQQYLLEAYFAVSSGECNDSIANRNPGKIAHSRWLTTANRVLRLYMSSLQPSEALKAIAIFVMKVYAPMWFLIKCQPSLTGAPKHLFEMIKRIRELEPTIQDIVKPVIRNNAYFAHPENIIFSMVHDERAAIRELGWRRMLKARDCANKEQLRQFKMPEINFEANEYYNLINWQNEQVLEPPLLKNIPTEDIQKKIRDKTMPGLTNSSIPCHSQAVERMIKLVTEASSKVCGKNEREGFITVTLESRKNMPKFETKNQFS